MITGEGLTFKYCAPMTHPAFGGLPLFSLLALSSELATLRNKKAATSSVIGLILFL
jgi:hypothetical protein